MYVSTEAIVDQFLRTFPDAFSAHDLSRFLANVGIKAPVAECINYLESNPYVFPLQKKQYMTRAGAFTGSCFSFKPGKREVEQGIFIAGHRCLPFVDSEVLSDSLQFYYNGTRLRNKIVEFESSAALDLFSLYGPEYASQYIASDPANKELDLAKNDFELPGRIHLTAFSLKPILDSCDFHYGDRFLCRLIDWDNGKIEITPLLTRGNRLQIAAADVDRQNWYEILESALLEEFDHMGPCASIEEQLANVFFEHRSELCCVNCGSVEE